MELKKRKLELELAATQKQLSTVVVTQPPPPHPGIVDPTKPLNPSDVVIHEPQPTFTQPPPPPSTFIPAQIPASNVRTRIAPVHPAMVNRSRDPRLARQTQQTMPKSHAMSHITQPMNDHIQPKMSTSKCITLC